jgi:hypothetical protein
MKLYVLIDNEIGRNKQCTAFFLKEDAIKKLNERILYYGDIPSFAINTMWVVPYWNGINCHTGEEVSMIIEECDFPDAYKIGGI